jgi:hypothetical protein
MQLMARYRIVCRPSRIRPEEAYYDVERFWWPFFWKHIAMCATKEEAKARVAKCKRGDSMSRIKKAVVWEDME